MKNMLLIAALAFGTAGFAQDKAATMEVPHEKCLLSADKENLAALGLNAEQMEKVLALQTECREKHATKEKGMDAKAKASTGERLQAILTPQQVQHWNTWCAKDKADATPMKKTDMASEKK